jgi:hypothetical protein
MALGGGLPRILSRGTPRLAMLSVSRTPSRRRVSAPEATSRSLNSRRAPREVLTGSDVGFVRLFRHHGRLTLEGMDSMSASFDTIRGGGSIG